MNSVGLLPANDDSRQFAAPEDRQRAGATVKSGQCPFEKFFDIGDSFGVDLRDDIPCSQPAGIASPVRVDFVDLKLPVGRFHRESEQSLGRKSGH